MLKFEQACEIAYKHFEKTKDIKGIFEIFDIGDSWLFFGLDFPPDIVQYGNVPIAIDKNNGEGYYFQHSTPENVEKFMKAKPLEVPEKYKLQYHHS